MTDGRKSIPLIMCSRCIMDSRVQEFELDDTGVCNFCRLYDSLDTQYPLNDEGRRKLNAVVELIKKHGARKKYDCIIGVSGGTDSTYTLILLKELGLRPLAVHFDNGWNTEVAVSNLKNALNRLEIDLHTYVVDWEEFKDLQLAFLKASVPEVELPTDLAIRSVLYRTAAEEGIRYVLEATSFRTEGVLPLSWGYKDGRYVRGIQKRFGSIPLKSFPNLTLGGYLYYTLIRRIRLVRILNYFAYRKADAKQVLAKRLDWVDYGGHHFESIYTRFFQSYIAPRKFDMDRRMVTYSAQVNSGILTREEALNLIRQEPYPERRIHEDKVYIAKKFKLSVEEFNQILQRPPKSPRDYPSYYPILKLARIIVKWAARRGMLPGFFQSGDVK